MKDIEAKDKKKLDALLKRYDYEVIAGQSPMQKPRWISPRGTIYDCLLHEIPFSYSVEDIEKTKPFSQVNALELARITLFLQILIKSLSQANSEQGFSVRMAYEIKSLPYKCKIEKNSYFLLEMYQLAQEILRKKCFGPLMIIDMEKADDQEYSMEELKYIIDKLEKMPMTDIPALGNFANSLQSRFNMIGLLSNVGTKGKGIVKELAFLYDFINEIIKGNDSSTLSNKEKSDKLKNAINSYLQWKKNVIGPKDQDAESY